MASESKGGEQRGLPYDTVCADCQFPLYKGTENYVRILTVTGGTVYECKRCGSMSAKERAELVRISTDSQMNQTTEQAKYDKLRDVMLSEADMEESIGGAADYVAWGSAAPRTSAGAEPAFWPSAAPADMVAEIERLRATSSTAAAAAATEWSEKSSVFTAPCDIENWTPEDAHASYLGFSAASAVPPKGVDVPRRWLGEAAMEASLQSAASAASDVPTMSSRQARILGGSQN